MNRYTSLLTKLGLSEKGAKIYICLLEYGKSGVTEIAKHAQLHRVEVYKELPYLLELLLIQQHISGKRRFYKAESPDKIEALFDDMKLSSSYIIQELKEKFKKEDEKPTLRFETGRKSISRVFSDIVSDLEKGEIFYRISSVKDVEMENSYLPKNYRLQRDSKEIERYAILSSSAALQKNPRLEREIAIIPESYEQFDENIILFIYKNKTVYVDYTTQSVITLENQKITNFQMKLFKTLFRSLQQKKS